MHSYIHTLTLEHAKFILVFTWYSPLDLIIYHVMVYDPIGSVQGPTSPFLWIMWWCVTLSAQSKVRPHPFFEYVMVCDPFGSVQGLTSPFWESCDSAWPSRLSPRSELTLFLNHVMVYDPLNSVQGPTSPIL